MHIPANYRLRLPGPTEVPERIRQAMALPTLGHRGPEFRAVISEAEALVQPLLGTRNRVLFLACSGTGAMEAAVVNIVAPGERILVLLHGQFGHRFVDIGRGLGAVVDTLEFEWGTAIDTAQVAAKLATQAYRALFVIHNESSTGNVVDLAALGALVKDSPTLLVADSVSGLGGIELRQDEWGVDIVVSAGQKALMCPPGIALASVSDKAWAVISRESATPRYYWDFRKARASVEKNETPYTSPVSLIGGMLEGLRMIHEEGIPAMLLRHQRLAAAMRAGGEALGLADFTKGGQKSATVAVLTVPVGLESAGIVKGMYSRYHTVIAGGIGQLSGKVIRIGTMGAITAGTVLTDLQQLETVLSGLGHPVIPGAGVAAAAACLAASA